MADHFFAEGVKPGGLTSGTEVRILLCTILESIKGPVTRPQLEQVLLGEELVNYFSMAEGLALLKEQNLIIETEAGFVLSEAGHTVGRTLAADVPRSVRDAAVRGVIRAQQYAAKQAVHKSEVLKGEHGRTVRCALGDETGDLFRMELYMPDELSAGAVREKFIESGDEVYKLVLAALTGNQQLAQQAIQKLDSSLPTAPIT